MCNFIVTHSTKRFVLLHCAYQHLFFVFYCSVRKLREITTCRMNEGESTWDVAQRYGVRLEALYKINAWPVGYQPGVGELIRLEGARLGMQTP